MSSSSSPSQARAKVGAIAAGTIGGVAFIVALTYLVFRFCLKSRAKPLYQNVGYEAVNDVDFRDVEEQRDRFLNPKRMRNINSRRWSKRTMETRWSSVRTESTRLSSLGFDRFSMKGLPPVPVILENRREGGG